MGGCSLNYFLALWGVNLILDETISSKWGASRDGSLIHSEFYVGKM